jgi:thiol-disulfide isomerase/thioredoxin
MAAAPQKRRSRNLVETVLLATIVTLAVQPSSFAQSANQQMLRKAVDEFRAGKQAQALEDFQALKKSNPDSVMIHFLTAQCNQALNHPAEAKEDFNWVATHGSEHEKSMAKYELYKMSPAGKTPGGASPNGTAPQGSGKVTKVIDFYADWCVPCKAFAPVFDATKPMFAGINFSRVNIDDPDHFAQCDLYGARRSIPRLVFLDKSGGVLFNNNPPPGGVDGFVALIKQFQK